MLIRPETQLYCCAGHFDSERTGRHVGAHIFVDYLLMLLVTWCTASQEDVRIQDSEAIAACIEDSLALLCKMLPEKAGRHLCLTGWTNVHR